MKFSDLHNRYKFPKVKICITPEDKIPTENALDPLHYTGQAIEPIEYIAANKLDFFEGNVVKYITRWKHKNGIEDLEKARVYIDFLINMVKNGHPKKTSR